MQYIIPHYYKKFACIGGGCPGTFFAGGGGFIGPPSPEKKKTACPIR